MLPLEASGRRPAFFDQPGLDQLLAMVLELAAEHWVLRERLFIIEAVLKQQGVTAHDAVGSFVPTDEEKAELARMRSEMTANMFRTLNREHRAVA